MSSSSDVKVFADHENTMLDAALVTGAGVSINLKTKDKVFTAWLSNTTTPVGVVDIEVSHDNSHWDLLGTISLNGADDSDSFPSSTVHNYYRGNITSISGTSAALTLAVNH